MIRVWALHDSHARYERTLQNSKTLATIIASHRRSMQVRQRLKLRQVGAAPQAGGNSKVSRVVWDLVNCQVKTVASCQPPCIRCCCRAC